jgi:hypothetical protein
MNPAQFEFWKPMRTGDTSGIECYSPTWVDVDNDGFLDLFVTRNSGGPISNLLYHNGGNSNAWLKVKLVGTVSNRSAVGAKVHVRATVGGKTLWQLRQIDAGGGWNVVPLVAHFGLGDATNVDTLRIEWPSGTVQEFANITPRQTLTITEPPRLLASTPTVCRSSSSRAGAFSSTKLTHPLTSPPGLRLPALSSPT